MGKSATLQMQATKNFGGIMPAIRRMRTRVPSILLTAAVSAVIAAATVPVCTAQAQTSSPVYEFNIPPSDLGEALRAFGTASNTQILFSPAVVTGHRSPAVQGRYSVDQAIGSLLADSELTYTRTSANVILVAQAKPAEAPAAQRRTVTRNVKRSSVRVGSHA